MEAFYELARVDYRYLAEAYDWASAFQSLANRKSGVRLIDVACGSGKFPQALLASPGVADLSKTPNFKLDYDLLDPSPFSVREAKQALAAPFYAGSEFCCKLQDWDEDSGLYDIAWATHALYCVPAEELEQGLARMCNSLSHDGFGFIAQGMRDGHYVGFYDQYLASMADGDGTPYSDGSQVETALKKLGMQVRTRVLNYTTVVPADRPQLLESYLQRCAFDDTFSLEEMLLREPLAGYLASCHNLDSGEYRFPQRVGMMLFSHAESGLTLCDAKISGVE
jgi:SAM-dependent methyltransferase